LTPGGFLGGLLALLVCMGAPASAADRPNVLIVMTDDQGFGDFSFTGNPLQKTPNLDRFAGSAIRLTST
jgi:arylsulfatase A-like enzyme